SLEGVEDRDLSLVNLLAGGGERKPGGAIDFGKLLLATGARRPFHGERVAPDRRRVAIGFHRPSVNGLAARLLVRPQCAMDSAGCEARLFRELALGRRQRLLG